MPTANVARRPTEPAAATDDPAVGFRAVRALLRLAEQVEAQQVIAARRQGWSWQQIGDALGITRQSVHAKHGRRKERLPLTPAARAIFTSLRHVAAGERLSRKHVLLALLARQRPDPAAELFDALGVDRDAVRDRLAEAQ